jgi:hypothetical protein
MTVRTRGSAVFFIASLLSLGASPAGAAGPAVEPEGGDPNAGAPDRPPALDAAFGTPPADATFGGGTTAEPGYADQGQAGPADQTYGSTARTYGADGDLVDGLQLYEEDLMPAETGYAEEVPDHHIVQQGDTLWDISAYYLHDSYQWPKVWSWNQHVTNAHWIFPGDRISLVDPALGGGDRGDGGGADDGGLRFGKTRVPESARQESFSLNQIAYVEAEEFETAMTIIGGAEAKVMMATLDTAYMDYDQGNPPVPGERLVVYAPREKVYDAKNKKVVGYVVQIMSEIDVTAVARKAAEGVLANSLNPVERGFRVGPLRRQFRRIERVEAERATTGFVVATLTSTGPVILGREKKKKKKRSRKRDRHHVLVGEEQFVIVDLGKSSGIKVGNVLEVVRKGDEYTEKRVFHIPYEDGWPRRVIGTLVVLQVGEDTSLCASAYSAREFERGDHVELGGHPSEDEERSPGGGLNAEASGDAKTGKGKVKGEGQFKIGN